jgi:outer membrane protein OmpA-like peptidoglycan-associated protein
MTTSKQSDLVASNARVNRSIASKIAEKSTLSGASAGVENRAGQQKPIIQRKPGEDEEIPIQRALMYNQRSTAQFFAYQHNPSAHTGPARTAFLQPKLSVNAPGDSHEIEADAMAEKVMRMKDPFSPLHRNDAGVNSGTTAIQRKCAACEEDEHVHRKENSGVETASSNELDNYVSTLGSSGQSLSERSRQFFEPRFSHDFSNVRIHSDSVAAKSAQSINALAYTTGNNIVFNHGQYSPGSESGQRLLAHELTHVVQQGGANIRRTKGGAKGDCAGYSQGEIEQSRTEKGMITNDVVETADDGLIIADFGVDWRHVKDSTRNNPALLNMLKKFESDDTYNHFTITGYSDCVGLENNNTDLRKGRAKNVTKLFDKKLKGKIASTTAASPGEFVTGNDTEVGRATNRSVIIRYGKDIAFNTDEDDAITGESCANPTKATTISDYIQLISCLENEHPSLGPREILSLIRQISYGGPLFKQAIPCQIDVGDPEKVISSKLYKALREHEIDTVDIGHVFTGLEAMVCPSDSVTITKSHISLDIEVANEDFVTWAGDLGSAVAHKIKDEKDNKPKRDISTYFGPGSVAGFDDMNGDIDGFVIRAGLNNINCAGSTKQSLTVPQSKISDLLREYYLGTGLGNDKLSVNTRYSCFVRALGADVSGGHIYGNMIDLRNKVKIATYRFSIPFFMKIGGAYAASAQGMDILFLDYSEQMANIFIEWLDAQVQIESSQQP